MLYFSLFLTSIFKYGLCIPSRCRINGKRVIEFFDRNLFCRLSNRLYMFCPFQAFHKRRFASPSVNPVMDYISHCNKVFKSFAVTFNKKHEWMGTIDESKFTYSRSTVVKSPPFSVLFVNLQTCRYKPAVQACCFFCPDHCLLAPFQVLSPYS